MMFAHKEGCVFIVSHLRVTASARRHLCFSRLGSGFASATRPIGLGSVFARGDTLCVLRTQRLQLKRQLGRLCFSRARRGFELSSSLLRRSERPLHLDTTLALSGVRCVLLTQ